MRSFSLVLLVAAVASLAAVVGTASGKDGVVARIVDVTPAHARPGTPLTVVWTLSSTEDGHRRPFGASGVFIRLFGGQGRSGRVYAAQGPAGRYRATVRVPAGGVRKVEIGLMGFNDFGPAPVLFRLVGGQPF
jgi:hypothetical protein